MALHPTYSNTIISLMTMKLMRTIMMMAVLVMMLQMQQMMVTVMATD